VEEKNKQITDSINYAQRIQSALLPGEEDVRKIIPESFLLFMPKDIVSGDFFWISRPDENTIVFATADCTGHGVPGGFMSMLGTSFLNEIINEKGLRSPAKILDALRDKIIVALKQQGHTQENKDGMDIVLCLLDKASGNMTYAAANNNFYLLRNGKLTEHEADKMPIGYYHDQVKPFREHTIALQPGDCVYTFTDGYADQFGGPNGKKFKYAQLEELILSQAQVSPLVQKEIFYTSIRHWQGELEQVDDICLFAFRYS
jgi:serine phosphatase RsbU (regulator of sigma subunit)